MIMEYDGIIGVYDDQKSWDQLDQKNWLDHHDPIIFKPGKPQIL